ncbi:MAG TPA: DUF998 domain-containing protein [Acidimicrobiales bacterium]|nr:DUF998 domain-containing protein [Acidimicrobiales bacterium]
MVGPVAFTTAWAVLGARTPGYSAVGDAISQLAATGAPEQVGMTAGLLALGLGLGAYGVALRAAVDGPAWASAVVTGAASLAVAALPLPANGADIPAHSFAAAAGYAALAAVPLLAAGPMARRAGGGWAAASRAAGIVCGACLLASGAGPASGLLQRAGLAVGHGWIAASALVLLRRPATPSS